MADFKKLPNDIANELVRKGTAFLGRALPTESLGAANGVGELVMSIEIWSLGASSILEAIALGLPRLARKTGRWHHQVKTDGNVSSWMRSKSMGPNPEDWIVTEASSSELATNIDRVASQIDDLDVPGEVRLLSVPAYQIWALWLLKEETDERLIFVVAAPEDHGFPLSIEETEFLERLAAIPIAEGLRE